jgi:voltage-gated potassium channel
VAPIFTHFTYNFFRVLWHFRSINLTLLAFLMGCAAAIAYVEKLPFGEALYFSFITGLTIGYGDIVAKTFLGRCVAILIGFIGILFSGLVVAAAVLAVRKTYHLD